MGTPVGLVLGDLVGTRAEVGTIVGDAVGISVGRPTIFDPSTHFTGVLRTSETLILPLSTFDVIIWSARVWHSVPG